MRKIILSIVLASLIFFTFNGKPLYAGACIPGSDGVTYDCQCLLYNEEAGRCDYMDCKVGFCCESDNTCPVSSFPPGTLIKIPVGSVKIEDLKVGDIVTSFKENNILDSRIRKIFKYQRDFYYSLIAGDYSVKASAEHPLYIGGGVFKVISKLKAGDTVYVLKNNALVKKTVTSNTRIDKSTPVYNLTVDNTNTYFAVHNKCFCATYDARPEGSAHACVPRVCMQNQHSYVILRSGATKNLYLCPNSPDLGQNETLRSPLHFVQGFGSG